MQKPPSRRVDLAAMYLSAACLIHCLILPVAAAFFPVLTHASQAEWIHFVFVALAIPVSVYALMLGQKNPMVTWIIRGGAALGLIMLTLGAFGWPSHDLETPLTVAGAGILAAIHWFNYNNRQHRQSHTS